MAGDIQGRQSSNASIANHLAGTVAPLIIDAVMMVFYFVVMLRYSLVLSAVGIASIIINLVFSRIISGKRVNITRVQMRDAGRLAGTTVAGIEMIETIKASGAENGFLKSGRDIRRASTHRTCGLQDLISILASYRNLFPC